MNWVMGAVLCSEWKVIIGLGLRDGCGVAGYMVELGQCSLVIGALMVHIFRVFELLLLGCGNGVFEGLGGGDEAGEIGGGDGAGGVGLGDERDEIVGVYAEDGAGGAPAGFQVGVGEDEEDPEADHERQEEVQATFERLFRKGLVGLSDEMGHGGGLVCGLWVLFQSVAIE